MGALISVNQAVIGALRDNLSDPVAGARTSPSDRFIYYKAPKAIPTFPMIDVSPADFTLEQISLDEGGVVGHKSYSQLFSGSAIAQTMTINQSYMDIDSVEYPVGTTLRRGDYWTDHQSGCAARRAHRFRRHLGELSHHRGR